MVIDADPTSVPMREYMEQEARFRMVELADPDRFQKLVRAAEQAVRDRHDLYEQLATIRYPAHGGSPSGPEAGDAEHPSDPEAGDAEHPSDPDPRERHDG
jgi:pyruvate-ferredoxin/flavodoxin oxidoreductase